MNEVTRFFPQALLAGFSFRTGEHKAFAVRKIAAKPKKVPICNKKTCPRTCSEGARYNFSVLLPNRHFQRFSPVNSLVLIMFLSHPETTKFMEKTNFWYEIGRISSPRRLSTIFLISASRSFFLKGSQFSQIMEFIVFNDFTRILVENSTRKGVSSRRIEQGKHWPN